jgi:hypothetical protein
MAKNGKKKGKKVMVEGIPVKLVFTHKPLRDELTNLSGLANRIEKILHSTATNEERALVATVQALLDEAFKQVAKITCPNPMYNVLTVDGDRLKEL